MKKPFAICYFFLLLTGCTPEKKVVAPMGIHTDTANIAYAKGFSIERFASGLTILTISSPWPNAEASFTYALVPKEKQASITLNKSEYDAIVSVPVETVIVTSTTHIPALEALDVLHRLVGFPDTSYISSKAARARIASGGIIDVGINENLNAEAVLAVRPDLVVGFSISGEPSTYATLQRSQIPVVYNGDWMEETPLGKAEWIKFFAPFFNKEKKADSIFKNIETAYLNAKKIARTAARKPTVLSGALYKDVWYLPAGKSWAANFIKDAHAHYLWEETQETGSHALSWESVLDTAKDADYWISPAQFTSYADMNSSSVHYTQFDAFKNKTVFTFSKTVGETGGSLYYELAPQRPDLVLQDLIHIFHKDVLPDYEPFFFKPLD
ncbi:MAG: ABC transporter substrate-binding protein [Maribacter sp.]